MSAEHNISETLQEQYRQRFADGADYRHALWGVLCRDFFQQYVNSQDTVLDLGCGWGEFSNNIRAATRYAMDLNPDAATHLSEEVQLLPQDCSLPWPLQDNSLDVVFTSNFLEHLPDKPAVERTVNEARRCLRPGGLFVAMGPNVRLVPGAYWDFWDHHVPISDSSLAELLLLTGFKVREKHPGFLPYTMSDGRQPSLMLVKLYLRLRLAWRVMGKQFLVVAENGS